MDWSVRVPFIAGQAFLFARDAKHDNLATIGRRAEVVPPALIELGRLLTAIGTSFYLIDGGYCFSKTSRIPAYPCLASS